jgi:shikimate dehydrogenase
VSHSYLLEKCCLIGEEVVGDPTHFMVERALADMGLDWRFLTFQADGNRAREALVGADALGVQGVRLRGVFCDASGAIDVVTTRARRTGRLTHLTRHEGRLQGDDAAGPALIEALAVSLRDLGDPVGKRVVLLGAGGAATSVADVLVEQGVSLLAVADRSSERAAAGVLAAQKTRSETTPIDGVATEILPVVWEENWIEMPDRIDWIVSLASWPKEENLKVAKTLSPEMHEGQLVVDLGVGSNRSPLLLAAETIGAKTMDGLPVLVGETALAIEAWTGASVNRSVLRDAAEEFLGV